MIFWSLSLFWGHRQNCSPYRATSGRIPPVSQRSGKRDWLLDHLTLRPAPHVPRCLSMSMSGSPRLHSEGALLQDTQGHLLVDSRVVTQIKTRPRGNIQDINFKKFQDIRRNKVQKKKKALLLSQNSKSIYIYKSFQLACWLLETHHQFLPSEAHDEIVVQV